MADPGPKKPRATYQDVLDAPDHLIAEILGGELRLSPRPGIPHARAASVLGGVIGAPFDHGPDGPGGWILLDEPELHLGDDVLVPDLAGWRRERMPTLPDAAAISMAPDWVCEVMSKSTETMDRAEKLPSYARAGVGHVWLLHPVLRTLEVLRRHEGAWLNLATYVGGAQVRAEPFEAVEIDLSLLWRDLPPPASRASEPGASYDYSHNDY